MFYLRDTKISEILFACAGVGMLVSLAFVAQIGFTAWIIPKIFYFTGIVFYVSGK